MISLSSNINNILYSFSVDIKQFDKSDCQKVSIVFDEFSYTICLSNKKIYIVKRLNRSQRRSSSIQTPDTTLSPIGQSTEGTDHLSTHAGNSSELA